MYALAYLRDINVPMLVEAGQLMIFCGTYTEDAQGTARFKTMRGISKTIFCAGDTSSSSWITLESESQANYSL